MVVTTEEWVDGYLKRLVFFAENEAINAGFEKELGGKMVSFCLYSVMSKMTDDEFEQKLFKLNECHSKSVDDCKSFLELYFAVSNNCFQFIHYVKNTQAYDYIKAHRFLKTWRRGNGGNYVAV